MYVQDEISICDKSKIKEAVENSFDKENPNIELFYDAFDELEEYQEHDPIVIQLKDGRHVEVPHSLSKVLKREQRHRKMRSRGQRTMPEFKDKNHYLVGVKAKGSARDKITGCYLTQDTEIQNKTKTNKAKKNKKIKKEEKKHKNNQNMDERELTKMERKAKYNELKRAMKEV